MNRIIFNGNNFFIIKHDRVEFWGMNIENPFGVIINDEIKKLHGKVMKELLPLFSYDVKNEMFFLDSDENFSEVSKVWVENYGKNHSDPENYHPHISSKCRKAEYHNFPVKFIASKIALCRLGNYCTCRTILGSHE